MSEHPCNKVDLGLETPKDTIEVGEIFEVDVGAVSEGAELSGVRVAVEYDLEALRYVGFRAVPFKGSVINAVVGHPVGGLPESGLCADVQVWSATGLVIPAVVYVSLFRLRFMGIREASAATIRIVEAFPPRITTKVIDLHGFRPPLTGELDSLGVKVESSLPRRQLEALRLASERLLGCPVDDYKAAAVVELIGDLLAEARL